MQKFISCIVVFFFLFIGCEDNTMQPTKKSTDQLQAPTSLEGTVWEHHPDTDPESYNWLNLGLKPEYANSTLMFPNGYSSNV